MNNNIEKVILLILIAIITITVSCDIDYNANEKKTYDNTPLEPLPASVADNVRFVIYNEEGVETAVVFGDKADFMDNGETIITNMRVLFRSQEADGTKYGELISDYGKMNSDTNNLEAWGNVVFIKENELRMETEKVYFESKGMENEGLASGDGVLKTEKDKLVTVYYADGTIVKGINGIYELSSKKLILEDTITETTRDNSLGVSP